VNRALVLLAAVGPVLAVALFASGCDRGPDRPAAEVFEPATPPGTDVPPVAAAGDTAIDAARDTAGRATADTGGWRPLTVPAPADPDTYPILIVNPHPVPLAVFADGGAGEVLVDTIPAGDSARVRLLIGADSVTLRAAGSDGVSGPPERIGLEREPTARWEARY